MQYVCILCEDVVDPLVAGPTLNKEVCFVNTEPRTIWCVLQVRTSQGSFSWFRARSRRNKGGFVSGERKRMRGPARVCTYSPPPGVHVGWGVAHT